MDDAEQPPATAATTRGIAVALIVLARFLSATKPEFLPYLRVSATHAGKSGIAVEDLAFLETLIRAAGGDKEGSSPPPG